MENERNRLLKFDCIDELVGQTLGKLLDKELMTRYGNQLPQAPTPEFYDAVSRNLEAPYNPNAEPPKDVTAVDSFKTWHNNQFGTEQ